MTGWPVDRITRNRTLTDEIYAIVFNALDKRPIPESDVPNDTLVYGDGEPGSGTSSLPIIIVATNDDLSGLVTGRSVAWPTPATIVVDNDGDLVTA